MDIDYSVVIRTIGAAGEKYQKLLDSILLLDPPPKEIIVVLPDGTPLPEQKIGTEKFYFCPIGMVRQRLYGLKQCHTKYVLVCDDDIAFGANFVQQLHEPIATGICSISTGPLLSFFVKRGLPAFCSAITASSMQTVFHKDHYVKMHLSGGWSFNRNIDVSSKHYYITESAAWTCFFAELDSLHQIDMEAENWIEKNKYASLDDQVMFYKGHCRGIRTIVVSNALYTHLDAQTSHTSAGISANEKAFARSFNAVLFWHRFIFSQKASYVIKTLSIFCFSYRIITSLLFSLLKSIIGRQPASILFCESRGLIAGLRYLSAPEYRQLRSVV